MAKEKQCKGHEKKPLTPKQIQDHTASLAKLMGTFTAMSSRITFNLLHTAAHHGEDNEVVMEAAQEILEMLAEYDTGSQIATMMFMSHHMLSEVLKHYYEQPEFMLAVLEYGAGARCLICDGPTPCDPKQLMEFIQTPKEKVN